MVPQTPLLTSDVLKEENETWPDVQQGMSLALQEMRVDQVNFLSVSVSIFYPGSSLTVNLETFSVPAEEIDIL